MGEAFFQATVNAMNSITTLCDIIHPITVAMWNTRSQVLGAYNVTPNATPYQMATKFGLGSGIHGVNYKRAFIDTPWEAQQESIAWLFLNGVFPIYEGWLESLSDQTFPSSNGKLSKKLMQYPSSNPEGSVLSEINRLTASESTIIKDAFYTKYSAKRHRCYSNLDNLLVCYRYFKEMRNCYMHNASIADTRLITAYHNFSHLTASDLNMSEIPMHYAPTLGARIKLSLRGVIGFSQVVLQIILTADTELLRSSYAEKELIERLKNTFPSPVSINSNRERASRQIVGIFKSAGYIAPDLSSLTQITQFLADNKIIQPVVYR